MHPQNAFPSSCSVSPQEAARLHPTGGRSDLLGASAPLGLAHAPTRPTRRQAPARPGPAYRPLRPLTPRRPPRLTCRWTPLQAMSRDPAGHRPRQKRRFPAPVVVPRPAPRSHRRHDHFASSRLAGSPAHMRTSPRRRPLRRHVMQRAAGAGAVLAPSALPGEAPPTTAVAQLQTPGNFLPRAMRLLHHCTQGPERWRTQGASLGRTEVR